MNEDGDGDICIFNVGIILMILFELGNDDGDIVVFFDTSTEVLIMATIFPSDRSSGVNSFISLVKVILGDNVDEWKGGLTEGKKEECMTWELLIVVGVKNI